MDAQVHLSPRRKYLRRHEALKRKRAPHLEDWRRIVAQVRPRAALFSLSDAGKAAYTNDIINSAARRAHRTLSSGMHTAITSQARPWFRLTTADPQLAEQDEVRSYLHQAEERLREAFARSNIYDCLLNVYDDEAAPGLSALHVEEDLDSENLLRGTVYPIGSYCIAAGSDGRVNTVYRELVLTVEQVVEKFGIANVSERVRRAYERCEYDDDVQILHVIEPNRKRRHGAAGPAGMAFVSAWLELQADEDAGFLRVSGYEELPTFCPRWTTTGTDPYPSTSPGHDSLGDCLALQLAERRAAQLKDKIVDPPMVAPVSLKGDGVSALPGETVYVDAMAGNATVRPMYEVPAQAIPVIRADIGELELRINRTFFADLFLFLSAQSGAQKTAEEVRALTEEKMLQLGPVLMRITNELLDPLIDRVFSILERLGLLPEAPEALQGVKLRVEYLSIIEQAQKALGIVAVERFLAIVGNLSQLDPSALDKLNIDEVVDTVADSLGIKPDLVLADDRVRQIRENRAKQAAAQQQQQGALAAAQGAATLSKASLDGNNALAAIVNGYGAPAPAGLQ